jgi:hypothetical protein
MVPGRYKKYIMDMRMDGNSRKGSQFCALIDKRVIYDIIVLRNDNTPSTPATRAVAPSTDKSSASPSVEL